MPKFWLYPDEWYPVLKIEGEEGDNLRTGEPADFTDEEIVAIRRAADEFCRWQDAIAKRFNKREHVHGCGQVVDE